MLYFAACALRHVLFPPMRDISPPLTMFQCRRRARYVSPPVERAPPSSDAADADATLPRCRLAPRALFSKAR